MNNSNVTVAKVTKIPDTTNPQRDKSGLPCDPAVLQRGIEAKRIIEERMES